MERISKIAYGVVVLLVTVLIISATVIPIVSVAQEEQVTEANNTGEIYRILQSDEDLIVSFSADVITINGVSYPESSGRILAFNDNFYIRIVSGNDNFQLITLDGSTGGTQSSFSVTDGVLTFGGQTKDATDLYVISLNGNYGEFASVFNTNEDSILYFVGNNVPVVNGENTISLRLMVTGTIKDGFTAIAYDMTNNVDASSNVTVALNDTYVTEMSGYYEVNATSWRVLTVSYVYDSVEYVQTAYSETTAFAPIEYTMITESDSAIRSMLGIIPVMMFIIPIMICIGLVRNRSD